MLQRLMIAGLSVSPAPTHTQTATIEAANMGSAKASIRRHCAPNCLISSTGVINAIISGAKTNITIPISAITAMPL